MPPHTGARLMFQFALPRGERHLHVAKLIHRRLVSIRAPARGATCDNRLKFMQKQVSIRAPARGATTKKAGIACCTGFQFALPRGERPRRRSHPSGSARFQFALPRGERPRGAVPIAITPDVSIRAPARGATQLILRLCDNRLFQFALPRGERPSAMTATNKPKQFQFALPRGERHRAASRWTSAKPFQFALPRGERLKYSSLHAPAAKFQFALPRGERRCLRFSYLLVARFNSRSREGSDITRAFIYIGQGVSIRAPARGATRTDDIDAFIKKGGFNSRSREGSDARG